MHDRGNDAHDHESGAHEHESGAHEHEPRAHTTVDQVSRESEGSFPASDPPSWSGSATSPGRNGEPPPEGEHAGWKIEQETGTHLDDDHDPDAEVLPSPEDARQG